MSMPIEITDLSQQKFKLYINEDVNKELEDKLTRNFSSSNREKRKRAAAYQYRLIDSTLCLFY